MTEQVFFKMSSDGSLGFRSHEIIHSSSHRHNYYDDITKEEFLKMSLVDERLRHMYLDTSNS